MSNYHERAWRIVDRVMPKLPPERTPHGFYEFDAFMEGAQRKGRHEGARRRLYWRTYARLRAKAEGGKPFIRLPQGSGHLFGPGDPMFDVAKELEALA